LGENVTKGFGADKEAGSNPVNFRSIILGVSVLGSPVLGSPPYDFDSDRRGLDKFFFSPLFFKQQSIYI
jgi:hypothetical protein